MPQKNDEIKIQENKKNLTKKIKFPPDRAPLLRDEVARNETREMHTKHARADPKFSRGEENFFFQIFQNKMFSHGIIHSITTNFKLLLCAAVRPKQCLPTPQKKCFKPV